MTLGRFPVSQRLQPQAQGDVLSLGGCVVLVTLGARHPDVYTHAGGVFERGASPAPFGLVHSLIMDSQIIIDNPSCEEYSVLTLNKEVVMEYAITLNNSQRSKVVTVKASSLYDAMVEAQIRNGGWNVSRDLFIEANQQLEQMLAI